jgi:hypothetical protein
MRQAIPGHGRGPENAPAAFSGAKENPALWPGPVLGKTRNEGPGYNLSSPCHDVAKGTQGSGKRGIVRSLVI